MGAFNSTQPNNHQNIIHEQVELRQITYLERPLLSEQNNQNPQEKNNCNKQNAITKQQLQTEQQMPINNQLNLNQNQGLPLDGQNNQLLNQQELVINIQSERENTFFDLSTNSEDEYIQIPLPQFILRNSFLLNWFWRLDRQFNHLVEFILYVLKAAYYMCLSLPLFFVVVTIIIASPSQTIYQESWILLHKNQIQNVSCLAVRHLITINDWMILDSVLTVTIFMFLTANWFYQRWLTRPHKRKIRQIKRKILSTWVIIFSLKYFILNLLGTMEYFNHIRPQFSCSRALDVYIQVQLLYNYISIIPLCIFALTNLL